MRRKVRQIYRVSESSFQRGLLHHRPKKFHNLFLKLIFIKNLNSRAWRKRIDDGSI